MGPGRGWASTPRRRPLGPAVGGPPPLVAGRGSWAWVGPHPSSPAVGPGRGWASTPRRRPLVLAVGGPSPSVAGRGSRAWVASVCRRRRWVPLLPDAAGRGSCCSLALPVVCFCLAQWELACHNFYSQDFGKRVLLMSLSGLCALGRIAEELQIWLTGFLSSLSSVGVVRASFQCSGEVEEWGTMVSTKSQSYRLWDHESGGGMGVGPPPAPLPQWSRGAPGMHTLGTYLRNLVKAPLFLVLGFVHDALGSHARSIFRLSTPNIPLRAFGRWNPSLGYKAFRASSRGKLVFSCVCDFVWRSAKFLPTSSPLVMSRHPGFVFATVHSRDLSISKWVCSLM